MQSFKIVGDSSKISGNSEFLNAVDLVEWAVRGAKILASMDHNKTI